MKRGGSMLEIRDIKGKWKKQTIENWELSIQEGKCVQLYGENVEVLYHMLLQNTPIQKGTVFWKEKPFFYQKEKIAWICENDTAFPYMSVKNYLAALCDFYEEFNEAWCLKLAEQKGILYQKIKDCTKEEKQYLLVLCALARNAELLISDTSFKEYEDKQDWKELFSKLHRTCTVLQISKEKETFWWRNADVYYRTQSMGLIEEIAEEKSIEKILEKSYPGFDAKENKEIHKVEKLQDLWGGEDDEQWKRPEE